MSTFEDAITPKAFKTIPSSLRSTGLRSSSRKASSQKSISTVSSKRQISSSKMSKKLGSSSASVKSTTSSNLPIPSQKIATDYSQIDKSPVKSTKSGKSKFGTSSSTNEFESIKAFLRIRPQSEKDLKTSTTSEPYLEVINDTDVLMNPPKDSSAPRARIHASAIPTKFTFSKVFSENTNNNSSQSNFFENTTLPMVNELLQGQSGLIFTYGVTNSGKSYTVHGGNSSNEAGILPRSLDVIFNSIKGVESSSNIRPVGLSGVEHAMTSDYQESQSLLNLSSISKKLAVSNDPLQYDYDTTTKVRIDRNYRYSVWASYIEVYNEKIFDLLDSSPANALSMPRSETIRGSNWNLAPSSGDSISSGGGICIQRKPLSLKNDIDAGGKYVSGLKEIRINNSSEARELMQRGQENRKVFATMANRSSSRSHGVFTIKIIREHGGEQDLSCQISRFSIVDLAGSERLSNTAATGERLKEAGSINKSLMCLGQCIETLRKNQLRAASFIPTPIQPISSINGSTIPKVLKRRPSIVPFRHSKLTELFQSFFTGEGRAVMIVNVNPYDTGFDENSHVMRFSAAAKEVQTIRNPAQATNLSRFVHPSLRNLFNSSSSPSKGSEIVPMPKSIPSSPRSVASPFVSPVLPQSPVFSKATTTTTTTKPSTSRVDQSVQAAVLPTINVATEITIIEVSDDEGEDEDDDENSGPDPFVEHLMQKFEQVKQLLFESELRCATIEQKVREEMAEEMSEQLLAMQETYNERLRSDAADNEEFINRKLDLLARATQIDSDDEEEDESAIFQDGLETFDESAEVEQTLASVARPRQSERDESSISDAPTMEDGSVVLISKRRAMGKQVIPDDDDDDDEEKEEEKEEEEEEQSLASQRKSVPGGLNLSNFEDSSISMDLPPKMIENISIQENEESLAVEESREAEGSVEQISEESEPSSESEEEEDSSFDITNESIESSFEAAPKARSSKARQSAAAKKKAPVKPQKTAAARGKKPASSTNRKPTTSRKKPTPLGESKTAGNSSISHDISSDASLILEKSPKKRSEGDSDDTTTIKRKSPKKRLLGRRKTLIDEETMFEQFGDQSLLDDLQLPRRQD